MAFMSSSPPSSGYWMIQWMLLAAPWMVETLNHQLVQDLATISSIGV